MRAKTSSEFLIAVVVLIVCCGVCQSVWADPQANKAIHQRIYEEVWNQGALDVLDEILCSDSVSHEPTGDVQGIEGYKLFYGMFSSAFSEIHFTVDEQIAEGDLVVTRFAATSTHTGELMGIPATGADVAITGITVAKIVEGKIVESWNNWDVLGMMQQLGAVEPARPGPEFYFWDAPSDITGDPGTAELNKLLALRIKSQFWNGKDIAGLDETHHAAAIGHDPSIPGDRTYESYKESCLAYQIAFPDFHVTIHSIVA